MVVTPQAEPIVAQAQRVLEQADLLEQMAMSQRDQLGSPLRVGAIFTVAPYLFPTMVPRVRAEAPEMPLFIEENYTHVLRGKLDRGELDAIIVALPFSGGGLVRAKMYEESFSVLLPGDHPWTKQQQIRPEQLLEETLLLLGEGHCFRDQVLELCPAIDSERQRNLVQIEGGSWKPCVTWWRPAWASRCCPTRRSTSMATTKPPSRCGRSRRRCLRAPSPWYGGTASPAQGHRGAAPRRAPRGAGGLTGAA